MAAATPSQRTRIDLSGSSAKRLKISPAGGSAGDGWGGKPLRQINLYLDPPDANINLIQFEDLGSRRLTLLREAEKLISLTDHKPDEINGLILDKVAASHIQLLNAADDVQSHFILRLAFCRSEDLRRWFSDMECRLLRAKFSEASPDEVLRVLSQSGIAAQTVHANQLGQDLKSALQLMHPGVSQWYPVSFREVIGLVGPRQVVLRGGRAYIVQSQLVDLIVGKFRANLNRSLAVLYRSQQNQAMASGGPDQRVQPVLDQLADGYAQGRNSFVGMPTGTVSVEQLPILSETSFPLCMSTLYQALRSEHHLRHGGRMQLGLFLKGIGLSVEESLAFWKDEFGKGGKITADKFDKQYRYNIRHNYGLEGKRMNYHPYSCRKIIAEQPSRGDHHGCPFKHHDPQSLEVRMVQKRVARADIDKIMDLVKGHHYQLACIKYFSATHGVQNPEDVGEHPNSYFEQSIKILHAKPDDPNKQEVKVEPTGSPVAAADPAASSASPPPADTSEVTIKPEPAEMVDDPEPDA